MVAIKHGSVRSRGIHFDASALIHLDNYLEALKTTSKVVMQKALLKNANKILREARPNAPFQTGSLQGSGRVTKPKKTATKTAFEFTVIFGGIFAVKKFVSYAAIQEEKHNFLQNALNSNPPSEIAGTVVMEMKTTIQKMATAFPGAFVGRGSGGRFVSLKGL